MNEIPNPKERNQTMLHLWIPALLHLNINEDEFNALRELGFCLTTPMQQGDWQYNEGIINDYLTQENVVPEKPLTIIHVDTLIFSMKGLIIKTANKPVCTDDDLAYALDYYGKDFIHAMSSNIVLNNLVLRLHDDLEIQTHILEPTTKWRNLNLPERATQQIICFVITEKLKK